MAQRFLVMLAISAVVPADCSELRESGRARQLSLEADWSNDLRAPKIVAYQSPIKRVVSLLNKMKAELEHEAKHEAEMYDRMACWCETNEKEKTKAIKDASAKDNQLGADIESRAARFGSLATQIEGMKKEISGLQSALRKATSIREKEAKAFAGEENSITKALANLKNAIIILSKHNSFLQVDGSLMMSVQTVLRDLALKHELLTDRDASTRRNKGMQTAFLALESESERASVHESSRMSRELINALNVKAAGDDTLPLKYAERLLARSAKVATPAEVFLQVEKPPGYSSGSGPVFGMLKQMQSDFKVAMEKAAEDEKKDIHDFNELSSAKKAQIDASKEKLDDLEDEAGENSKALSDAKEDLEMTRNQRSSDVKFLSNLKTTCQGLDKQWGQRSKTRSAETQAVSEALAVISNDDSMDLLRDSVKFVQLKAMTKDVRRVEAAGVLRAGLNNMFDAADDMLSAWEGRHSNSAIRSVTDSLHSSRTQLAALAVTVQLDSFTKVKAAIDKLVGELKKQQSEEVQFKAKCVENFNGNEKAVFKKTDEKGDLEAKLTELAAHMKSLSDDIAEAKRQIKDTTAEINKADENRKEENKQYQIVVADQRATQGILKKALAKLTSFYKKKAAFVQVTSEDGIESGQIPPVQFNKMKSNSGASPVIGLIEQIIEDSAKLESDSTSGEKEAQAEYEKFVKDSNALVSTLSTTVVEKTKIISDAKSKTADAKGDLQSAKNTLASLGKVEEDLHTECDFVLKNFQLRQKARLTELEAIQAAKGVLSGAKVK